MLLYNEVMALLRRGWIASASYIGENAIPLPR